MKLVKAEFCKPSSHVDRIKTKELGGGGCLDRGIYVISLACMVFGEMPESISAVGNLMSTGNRHTLFLAGDQQKFILLGGMHASECQQVLVCSRFFLSKWLFPRRPCQ